MEISVVGISHKVAPVEVRERLALSDEQVGSLLEALRKERIFEEALILSTCNRTEVYFVAPQRHDLAHFNSHLQQATGCKTDFPAMGGYRYDGADAVRQLFRVAASLESQLVGEDEILGQVKKAYRLALQARSPKFLLHKLMHKAFRVGKRVRTETLLTAGNSSVPQAAVSLAQKRLGRLEEKAALLVGAGDMGVAAARALLAAGVRQLTILNRTMSRAEKLARELSSEPPPARDAGCPDECGKDDCGARRRSGRCARQCAMEATVPARTAIAAGGLDRLPAALERADLVVCATAGHAPVIEAAAVGDILLRRRRELLMLDISMPRAIDEAVASFPRVRLFNLNDLQATVDENLRKRRSEIPKAEAIVDEEVAVWQEWIDSLKVTRSIKLFKRQMERILEDELQRRSSGTTPEQREKLRLFGQSLCNKIQHRPFVFLKKRAAQRSASDVIAAAELFHRMFDLDAQ